MMPCNRTVHFRPWRFFASCLAFVLAFAALVKGHGYLSYPAARNINDYCKQCLNGGGGALVNAGGGYAHGMCGNSKDDAQQTWNVPGGIQATYVEGQAFDIAVVITAHHMGYFALELCDTPDITEVHIRCGDSSPELIICRDGMSISVHTSPAFLNVTLNMCIHCHRSTTNKKRGDSEKTTQTEAL